MFKSASSSNSRQKLEEFRLQLESNFKKPVVKEEREASIRKSTPFMRFKEFTEDIQRSTTPKRVESPRLNHYRNLSYFKSQVSPKSSPKHNLMKNSEILYSDVMSIKKKEKLSDVIPIETLCTATNAIMKNGIDSVPKVYAAQLKEFCNEVLSKLR